MQGTSEQVRVICQGERVCTVRCVAARLVRGRDQPLKLLQDWLWPRVIAHRDARPLTIRRRRAEWLRCRLS